jgi:outer membrane receptor protein involved in Fe transport
VFTDVGVPQEQSRLPGRTVVNGRLGYDYRGITLFAFARNLLDADYSQYTFTGGNRAILGEPQTFGIGLEAHL